MARTPYVIGRKHNVFMAVRSDGSEPASVMLAELRAGRWKPDPDHRPEDMWPDALQPRDAMKMVAVIDFFAQTGTPRRSHHLNELEDGVWEFKVATKRISFYDTDGLGNAFSKTKNRTPEMCSRGANDPWWEIPDFEKQLCLGHGFGKTGPRTDPADIQESLIVREEDLGHDRAA